MATINQLSAVDAVTASDQVPLWSSSQGDSRKFSLTTLVTFLSTAFSSLRAVSYIATNATTVANLPTAASAGAGARAFVTDANSTSFNASLVGGGSNAVPVFSDGSAWKVG
jgi:hypothetical protein